MNEKLKEILLKNRRKIEELELGRQTLVFEMSFLQNHSFDEEYRIANTKYHAMDNAIRGYRDMYDTIKDLLDKWES